jgi:hypothetical protein
VRYEKCLDSDSDGSVWGLMLGALLGEGMAERTEGSRLQRRHRASDAIHGSSSPGQTPALQFVRADGATVFRWVLDFWFTEMEGTSESLNRGAGGGDDPPF